MLAIARMCLNYYCDDIPSGGKMAQYCLLGIGNRVRGDDGAGSILASRFRHDDWISIDAGPMPENFTGIIKKSGPRILVIVDACDLGRPPGTFMRIQPSTLSRGNGFGTHTSPMSLFIDYLEKYVRDIIFIGIQPGDISIEEGLSPGVEDAIQRLMEILKNREFEAIPSGP